jgi:tetratricopeptide (TPR) repeat protein
MFRLNGIVGAALGCWLLSAGAQSTRTPLADIESLIRSQQYDRALAAIHAELRGHPGDYKFWTLDGICLAMQGNDSDALTAFDHAVRISPSYSPALKGEVQILYKTGDGRAIPLLNALLKNEPDDITAHEMLATLEAQKGDCRVAVNQFLLSKDAIADHPGSLEAYGDCLFKLGRAADAIPVFRQLVPLLPGRTYPSYDLAVLQVAAHDNQAAIATLEPFLTPNQTDADLLSLASQAFEASGDTPKAVTLQRQAIVADPNDAANYVLFAVLCLTHDSFRVGIDMLDAGLKRIPENSSLYRSRGVLYVQLGEYDKAESDFKMAEKLDSAHSISIYAGDLATLERDNPDLALTRVREQLKSHSQDPLLHLLMAQLLMTKGPGPQSPEFKEAMQNAQTAVNIRPDLVDAHNQLASMYMTLGQYDRAVKECRTAMQYDPSNETALYHLIISLRHTGGNEDLRPLVKRLAELHEQSRQRESDRKRFQLVEVPAPSEKPGAAH